ncbi:50S ribosomal protein L19e [Candidatus Woesearchaeota archaeon]|nr:50S ribosomal protein L19e [Candidatus Woesearchaeota archaeon]
MKLTLQKRIAAQLLKCGINRVKFDSERLEDIKEAITKSDMKSLISDDAVIKAPETGAARSKARKKLVQKRKKRQKGPGSRKGKKTARMPKKKSWINKIRIQRRFLKELREKGIITKTTYHDLYLKSKGGFFRSKRHIKLYLDEHDLTKKK